MKDAKKKKEGKFGERKGTRRMRLDTSQKGGGESCLTGGVFFKNKGGSKSPGLGGGEAKLVRRRIHPRYAVGQSWRKFPPVVGGETFCKEMNVEERRKTNGVSAKKGLPAMGKSCRSQERFQ